MKTVYTLIGLTFASFTAHAESADIDSGQELHQENCANQCHGNEVYTRADRKMQRFESIQSQVARCEQSLKLQWFEDDINDVAAYLNSAFYKFPAK